MSKEQLQDFIISISNASTKDVTTSTIHRPDGMDQNYIRIVFSTGNEITLSAVEGSDFLVELDGETLHAEDISA